MGHIPVGMEMFSAGDEQQWKLIQTQIQDCDYYVVISAFRYGSLDGEIGYTEKEYDYAVSIDIPVLGFVIEDVASWPATKVDKNAIKVEKLEQFKSKIQGRLVSYWKDKNDLYGKVSIALMKQFNTNPRVGWVKSTEQLGPEILNEISRLSNENSELRKENVRFQKNIDQEKKEEFEETLNTLKHNKRSMAFYYLLGREWEDNTEFTLLEIFDLLAPKLMMEISVKYCADYLGLMLHPNKDREIRPDWGTPSNSVQKILADLNVLEIIQPSPKKHSIKDENEYWSLADKGKKLFKVVRRELLAKNLELALNPEPEEEQKIEKKKPTKKKKAGTKKK